MKVLESYNLDVGKIFMDTLEYYTQAVLIKLTKHINKVRN